MSVSLFSSHSDSVPVTFSKRKSFFFCGKVSFCREKKKTPQSLLWWSEQIGNEKVNEIFTKVSMGRLEVRLNWHTLIKINWPVKWVCLTTVKDWWISQRVQEGKWLRTDPPCWGQILYDEQQFILFVNEEERFSTYTFGSGIVFFFFFWFTVIVSICITACKYH